MYGGDQFNQQQQPAQDSGGGGVKRSFPPSQERCGDGEVVFTFTLIFIA